MCMHHEYCPLTYIPITSTRGQFGSLMRPAMSPVRLLEPIGGRGLARIESNVFSETKYT